MSCCTNGIKDLGCIYSCDTVQIGENAPATGVFIIELQPEGIKVVSTTNTNGSPLAFTGGYLNEDAVSLFKIIKPDGNYYETPDGEDCFKVSVKPATNPTLADTDVDPIECSCEYDININGVFSQTVTLTSCADLTINLV